MNRKEAIGIGKHTNFITDYNLMAPQDMDELLFDAFEQSLGEETRERVRKQLENYDYYSGKQHRGSFGTLVDAEDLPKPSDLDYKPTRYSTNYFKAIINRKARWQMGGEHGVQVPREQVDDALEAIEEGYEPSDKQRRSNEIAEGYEKLLNDLWRENRMRSSLVKAARDRLIADRAVCKIVFNPRDGKLRWVWRPDTEFIPIYSDDDFGDLIACHFVKQKVIDIRGEDTQVVHKQTYRLMDDGECWGEEAVYRVRDLKLVETITELKPMNLDFIPIVMFPVDELLASEVGAGEIDDLRSQNDVLNQMNEDAIDSLKFEMFPMTVVFNTPAGSAEQMKIAPGAVFEAVGDRDGVSPDVRKIESGFRWKEAFKDQYSRVKGAMHEISGLPQIVPQELNFGGLNGEALRVLFHDIITDTEEHWLTWEYGLEELHEKSIRYLKLRLGEPNFSYDKEVVKSIDNYDNEINFVLPLPDNRKELVELLSDEMANELESKSGAMERLGVENVIAKKAEIDGEKIHEKKMDDPYGGVDSFGESGADEEAYIKRAKTRRDENGELEVLCNTCGGTGRVPSESGDGDMTCPKCRGSGWFQPRKR